MDPSEAKWRPSYARLNVASNVRLAGTLSPERVAEELRCASIFVLASRFEGFGTVVIEAMACGKPIVMTATEASPELIEHSVRGRIVPIDDVEELASALNEMIGLGSERLQAMGTACRQWVEETHSWQRISREYERVFEAVLARRALQGTRVSRTSSAGQLP